VIVFARLEAFARRPAAGATMALWAAAEAIVLPVVPDIGLGLLVFAAPRLAMRLFLAVVAGALVGTVLLAILATAAPESARAMLLSIPGVDAATLAEADAKLANEGIAGFAQFGPGAPLKVYTEAWVRQHRDIPVLLVGTVLNRLARIGPAIVVAAVLGWWLGSWIRKRERLFLLAYCAFWVAMYVVLYST
jgi:hypothetical protein